MTIEKKEGEIPQKQLSPEEKENLIETGMGYVDRDPKIAEKFFREAGLSNEEIQKRVAEKEWREVDKKGRLRVEKEERKVGLRETYEELLKKAEEEGNEIAADGWRAAIKKLEESE